MGSVNKKGKLSRFEKTQASISTVLAIITLFLTWKTLELNTRVKDGDIEIKRIAQELQEEKIGFDKTRDIYDRVEKYLSSEQDEKKGIALVALIRTVSDVETQEQLLSAISYGADSQPVAFEAAEVISKTTIIQRNQSGTRFIGNLVLDIATDGDLATIKEEFGFVDSRGQVWTVPAGTVTDGASLPVAFRSIYGSSFDQELIKASALHDHYVQTKVRSWQDTHQMFYEALLASDVEVIKAKILYASVAQFGPRWVAK